MFGSTPHTFWQHVGDEISRASGVPFRMDTSRSIGGGCINSATVVEGSGQKFFVKVNRAELLHMFEAEGEALALMAQTQMKKFITALSLLSLIKNNLNS